MRLSPLLATALLAAACTPQPEAAEAAGSAPLSAAALDSVAAVSAAWQAAVNAGDTAAVAALYASDARILPPDSPILGKADGMATFAAYLAAGAKDFKLNRVTGYGSGDLAYQVGNASFTMGDATEEMKYMEVMRRGDDGQWRYVADMFSSVAPAADQE